MTDMQTLEPLHFPLTGTQLIEASAGTGKTYTITALYLRLLLGHADGGSATPLGPEQILVVTFTEAATGELRDRIRSRIADAHLAFLLGRSDDPFVQQLIDATEDRARAVKLLANAAQQMDEAAVFTIHGFCQRMLKRHAFESGALFETELTQEGEQLLQQAVTDFWRAEIYPMPADIAAKVLCTWATPAALNGALRNLWSTPELRLEPDLSDVDIRACYAAYRQQRDDLRREWQAADMDELFGVIQASGVNKRSYSKKNTPNWIAQVGAFLSSERPEPDPKLDRTALDKLTQSALCASAGSAAAPMHPLFEQIEALLAAIVPLQAIMLSKAYREVQRRFSLHKHRNNLLTFDDLLGQLDRALAAENGSLLAQAIRQQFPRALIDEFQDTDPLQYRIFSRIYAGEADTGLVMIGDPKQAIYAFRGADIFTYIRARRQVTAPYTLETNWRSTQAMIAAVNHLFAQAQAPFIYEQDIRFQPVRTAGKSDKTPFNRSGVTQPAMTLWYEADEEPISRQQYLARFARATAVEIEQLLDGTHAIGERPLVAGDLAVLVRDRFEADAVRSALSEMGRPCVYLSNSDSVFSTREALDLLLILQAVQEPYNERFVRAALATALLQLDAEALDRLNHDERAWEAAVTEFEEYQQRWTRLGVLPMLHRLLQRRQLAAQMLSRPDGERRLTDLLHLGELLQQASAGVESAAGLLRWYVERLNNPNGRLEAQQLRLESDRNLVTLVTIHKSKGLEYPVVFLPFPCSMRESKTALYHDEQGAAVFDLNAAQEHLERAEQERLAEDLRLLYVALTRSVYRCYLGLADVKIARSKDKLDKTALGYLLMQQGCSLEQGAQRLADGCDGITLQLPPLAEPQRDMFAQSDSTAPALAARPFHHTIKRDWRVTSYSALSSSHGAAQPLPERGVLDLEVAGEQDSGVSAEHTIFTFPKGARAGTFLHSVFEELDFPTAGGEALNVWLAQQLTLAGYEEHWQAVLCGLVADVLDTDLDGHGLRLRNLGAGDKVVEMEFMLSANGLECAALEALTRRYDPLSERAGRLHFERVRGMLKGFIDLVFRHDGRYYVVDYKSNHLGSSVSDYSRDAMAAAMIDHRYDLQYQLYTLALHRLLQLRIPDYDYERDFGGVFYLFLRGMGEGDNGVYGCRPPLALVEGLDRLFSGDTGKAGGEEGKKEGEV